MEHCEHFHKYLYGGKFEVYTDNNPLTYILTSAKLDATGQRWVASLANYNFTIHYRSGEQNVEVDALSKIKWQHDDAMVVKAILVRGLNTDTMIPQPFEQNTIKCCNINLAGAPEISKEDWVKEQGADEDIGPVAELGEENICNIPVRKGILPE